jgi:hypothetical protein
MRLSDFIEDRKRMIVHPGPKSTKGSNLLMIFCRKVRPAISIKIKIIKYAIFPHSININSTAGRISKPVKNSFNDNTLYLL